MSKYIDVSCVDRKAVFPRTETGKQIYSIYAIDYAPTSDGFDPTEGFIQTLRTGLVIQPIGLNGVVVHGSDNLYDHGVFMCHSVVIGPGNTQELVVRVYNPNPNHGQLTFPLQVGVMVPCDMVPGMHIRSMDQSTSRSKRGPAKGPLRGVAVKEKPAPSFAEDDDETFGYVS